MRPTLTVNLGGMQFTFNDNAYRLMSQYLQSLTDAFRAQGLDADELVNDIENRCAEILDETHDRATYIVTEGDITPRAMLTATYLTLGLACAIGCSLIYWGGWWMLPAGIAIALGVVVYSAGPYPLSRHGLGEVAVIVFFGIAPVNLTYYLMAGHFGHEVLMASLAVGLMGADVLIINNYRDADADRAVGKHTLAVILGRPAVRTLYLANGLVAIVLMQNLWHLLPAAALIVPGLYTVALAAIWLMMGCRRGHALTPLLGMTAVNMLVFSIGLIIIAITI